jgi:hypothetical protein
LNARLAATVAKVAAVSFALLGCHDPSSDREAGVAPGAPEAAAAIAVDATPPPARIVDASPAIDAALASSVDAGPTLRPSVLDGGASSCKRIYGPARQPFEGPAALAVRGDRLDLITNDRGKPQVVSVAIPASLTAVVPPPATPPPRLHDTVHPPCAVAGETVYCVALGGILTRFPREGPPKEVATVISVRGIAAASLGPGHDVVAFHQQRKTTEGFVSESWVSLDGQPPERLSEEGSGSTALDLAVAPASTAEAPEVLALSLDARVAMTPMHARHLSLEAGRLKMGTDEVVFIGPLAEPGTVPRLATSRARAYALAAWPREAADFGLSVVALPEPLRIDLPAVWSLYKNGLDPAPLAATRGSDPVALARVVPATVDRHGDLVLELGMLATDGAFVTTGEIARGRTLADVSITRDGKGALWLLWSDGDGTWLERRVCP